mmetsp:Transcript_23079/g.36869  ORF Transcript_23079/g.36869 Transcript_23079/m.36869 type:complete len:197 (+) Transcript_23079:62-652(+)
MTYLAFLSLAVLAKSASPPLRGQANAATFKLQPDGPLAREIKVNLAFAQDLMSKANTSVPTFVAVREAPLYYECGSALNTAWSAMARDPCATHTWEASDAMKKVVPKCSKLRDGEKYTASYQALLLDQDTWCGPPYCEPECKKGVKCYRTGEFPFEPMCHNNMTVKESPPAKSGASSCGAWSALIASLIAVHVGMC